MDQETGLRDPESTIRITPWTACKTGLKSKKGEQSLTKDTGRDESGMDTDTREKYRLEILHADSASAMKKMEELSQMFRKEMELMTGKQV